MKKINKIISSFILVAFLTTSLTPSPYVLESIAIKHAYAAAQQQDLGTGSSGNPLTAEDYQHADGYEGRYMSEEERSAICAKRKPEGGQMTKAQCLEACGSAGTIQCRIPTTQYEGVKCYSCSSSGEPTCYSAGFLPIPHPVCQPGGWCHDNPAYECCPITAVATLPIPGDKRPKMRGHPESQDVPSRPIVPPLNCQTCCKKGDYCPAKYPGTFEGPVPACTTNCTSKGLMCKYVGQVKKHPTTGKLLFPKPACYKCVKKPIPPPPVVACAQGGIIILVGSGGELMDPGGLAAGSGGIGMTIAMDPATGKPIIPSAEQTDEFERRIREEFGVGESGAVRPGKVNVIGDESGEFDDETVDEFMERINSESPVDDDDDDVETELVQMELQGQTSTGETIKVKPGSGTVEVTGCTGSSCPPVFQDFSDVECTGSACPPTFQDFSDVECTGSACPDDQIANTDEDDDDDIETEMVQMDLQGETSTGETIKVTPGSETTKTSTEIEGVTVDTTDYSQTTTAREKNPRSRKNCVEMGFDDRGRCEDNCRNYPKSQCVEGATAENGEQCYICPVYEAEQTKRRQEWDEMLGQQDEGDDESDIPLPTNTGGDPFAGIDFDDDDEDESVDEFIDDVNEADPVTTEEPTPQERKIEIQREINSLMNQSGRAVDLKLHKLKHELANIERVERGERPIEYTPPPATTTTRERTTTTERPTTTTQERPTQIQERDNRGCAEIPGGHTKGVCDTFCKAVNRGTNLGKSCVATITAPNGEQCYACPGTPEYENPGMDGCYQIGKLTKIGCQYADCDNKCVTNGRAPNGELCWKCAEDDVAPVMPEIRDTSGVESTQARLERIRKTKRDDPANAHETAAWIGALFSDDSPFEDSEAGRRLAETDQGRKIAADFARTQYEINSDVFAGRSSAPTFQEWMDAEAGRQAELDELAPTNYELWQIEQVKKDEIRTQELDQFRTDITTYQGEIMKTVWEQMKDSEHYDPSKLEQLLLTSAEVQHKIKRTEDMAERAIIWGTAREAAIKRWIELNPELYNDPEKPYIRRSVNNALHMAQIKIIENKMTLLELSMIFHVALIFDVATFWITWAAAGVGKIGTELTEQGLRMTLQAARQEAGRRTAYVVGEKMVPQAGKEGFETAFREGAEAFWGGAARREATETVVEGGAKAGVTTAGTQVTARGAGEVLEGVGREGVEEVTERGGKELAERAPALLGQGADEVVAPAVGEYVEKAAGQAIDRPGFYKNILRHVMQSEEDDLVEAALKMGVSKKQINLWQQAGDDIYIKLLERAGLEFVEFNGQAFAKELGIKLTSKELLSLTTRLFAGTATRAEKQTFVEMVQQAEKQGVDLFAEMARRGTIDDMNGWQALVSEFSTGTLREIYKKIIKEGAQETVEEGTQILGREATEAILQGGSRELADGTVMLGQQQVRQFMSEGIQVAADGTIRLSQQQAREFAEAGIKSAADGTIKLAPQQVRQFMQSGAEQAADGTIKLTGQQIQRLLGQTAGQAGETAFRNADTVIDDLLGKTVILTPEQVARFMGSTLDEALEGATRILPNQADDLAETMIEGALAKTTQLTPQQAMRAADTVVDNILEKTVVMTPREAANFARTVLDNILDKTVRISPTQAKEMAETIIGDILEKTVQMSPREAGELAETVIGEILEKTVRMSPREAAELADTVIGNILEKTVRMGPREAAQLADTVVGEILTKTVRMTPEQGAQFAKTVIGNLLEKTTIMSPREAFRLAETFVERNLDNTVILTKEQMEAFIQDGTETIILKATRQGAREVAQPNLGNALTVVDNIMDKTVKLTPQQIQSFLRGTIDEAVEATVKLTPREATELAETIIERTLARTPNLTGPQAKELAETVIEQLLERTVKLSPREASQLAETVIMESLKKTVRMSPQEARELAETVIINTLDETVKMTPRQAAELAETVIGNVMEKTVRMSPQEAGELAKTVLMNTLDETIKMSPREAAEMADTVIGEILAKTVRLSPAEASQFAKTVVGELLDETVKLTPKQAAELADTVIGEILTKTVRMTPQQAAQMADTVVGEILTGTVKMSYREAIQFSETVIERIIPQTVRLTQKEAAELAETVVGNLLDDTVKLSKKQIDDFIRGTTDDVLTQTVKMSPKEAAELAPTVIGDVVGAKTVRMTFDQALRTADTVIDRLIDKTVTMSPRQSAELAETVIDNLLAKTVTLSPREATKLAETVIDNMLADTVKLSQREAAQFAETVIDNIMEKTVIMSRKEASELAETVIGNILNKTEMMTQRQIRELSETIVDDIIPYTVRMPVKDAQDFMKTIIINTMDRTVTLTPRASDDLAKTYVSNFLEKTVSLTPQQIPKFVKNAADEILAKTVRLEANEATLLAETLIKGSLQKTTQLAPNQATQLATTIIENILPRTTRLSGREALEFADTLISNSLRNTTRMTKEETKTFVQRVVEGVLKHAVQLPREDKINIVKLIVNTALTNIVTNISAAELMKLLGFEKISVDRDEKYEYTLNEGTDVDSVIDDLQNIPEYLNKQARKRRENEIKAVEKKIDGLIVKKRNATFEQLQELNKELNKLYKERDFLKREFELWKLRTMPIEQLKEKKTQLESNIKKLEKRIKKAQQYPEDGAKDSYIDTLKRTLKRDQELLKDVEKIYKSRLKIQKKISTSESKINSADEKLQNKIGSSSSEKVAMAPQAEPSVNKEKIATADGGHIIVTTVVAEDGSTQITREKFNAQGERMAMQSFAKPGKSEQPGSGIMASNLDMPEQTLKRDQDLLKDASQIFEQRLKVRKIISTDGLSKKDRQLSTDDNEIDSVIGELHQTTEAESTEQARNRRENEIMEVQGKIDALESQKKNASNRKKVKIDKQISKLQKEKDFYKKEFQLWNLRTMPLDKLESNINQLKNRIEKLQEQILNKRLNGWFDQIKDDLGDAGNRELLKNYNKSFGELLGLSAQEKVDLLKSWKAAARKLDSAFDNMVKKKTYADNLDPYTNKAKQIYDSYIKEGKIEEAESSLWGNYLTAKREYEALIKEHPLLGIRPGGAFVDDPPLFQKLIKTRFYHLSKKDQVKQFDKYMKSGQMQSPYVLKGLLLVNEEYRRQLLKFAEELKGYQNLSDSDKVRLMAKLQSQAGTVFEAYKEMIKAKASATEVKQQGDLYRNRQKQLYDLYIKEGETQKANESLWGVYLSRRQKYLNLIDKYPLLAITNSTKVPGTDASRFGGTELFKALSKIETSDNWDQDRQKDMIELLNEYLADALESTNDLNDVAAKITSIEDLIEFASGQYKRQQESASLLSPLHQKYIQELRLAYATYETEGSYYEAIVNGSLAVIAGGSFFIPVVGPWISLGVSVIVVTIEGDKLVVRYFDRKSAESAAPVTGYKHVLTTNERENEQIGNLGLAIVGLGLDLSAVKGVTQIRVLESGEEIAEGAFRTEKTMKDFMAEAEGRLAKAKQQGGVAQADIDKRAMAGVKQREEARTVFGMAKQPKGKGQPTGLSREDADFFIAKSPEATRSEFIAIELTELDEIIKTAQKGGVVPQSEINAAIARLREEGRITMKSVKRIENELIIAEANAKGVTILVHPDSVEPYFKFIGNANPNSMKPMDITMMAEIKAKAALEAAGKPQVWTQAEAEMVKNVILPEGKKALDWFEFTPTQRLDPGEHGLNQILNQDNLDDINKAFSGDGPNIVRSGPGGTRRFPGNGDNPPSPPPSGGGPSKEEGIGDIIGDAMKQTDGQLIRDARKGAKSYIPADQVPHYGGKNVENGKIELGEIIRDNYARTGGGDVPALHTTSRDALDGIAKKGLEGTADRSATWSYRGTLREGDIAIRLSKEGKNFVQLVPAEKGFGQIPRYYPGGIVDGVGSGPYVDDIPGELLEYFNYRTDQWLPLVK